MAITYKEVKGGYIKHGTKRLRRGHVPRKQETTEIKRFQYGRIYKTKEELIAIPKAKTKPHTTKQHIVKIKTRKKKKIHRKRSVNYVDMFNSDMDKLFASIM